MSGGGTDEGGVYGRKGNRETGEIGITPLGQKR